MSITTRTLTAALAFGLGLSATAGVAEAMMIGCMPGDEFITEELSSVTHNWSTSSAWRWGAAAFAQAVTHNGSDAGAIRVHDTRVRFQESRNGGHAGETVHLLFVCDVPDSDRMERGDFIHTAASQSTMTVIDFDNEYDNPVFFAQVKTSHGTDPIVATPIVVSGTRAIVALMEPDNYDGANPVEEVSWMVAEAGQYELNDGRFVTIGTVDVITHDYDRDDMRYVTPTVMDPGVYFSTPPLYCLEDARIFTQQQAAMAAEWHGTRVEQDVDGGVLQGFGVRHMRPQGVEYSSAPDSTTGTIGFMVIGDKANVSCEDDWSAWDNYYTAQWGDADAADDDEASIAATELFSELCGGGTEVIDMVWSQGDEWGSSTIGADYSVRAGLSDYRNEGGDLWVGGDADAHVTLFDEALTVLDVGPEGTTDASGDSGSRAWLYVLGAEVFDQAASVSMDHSHEQTLFQVSAVFYGVTVSASAVGTFGIDGSLDFGPAGIELEDVGPYANLSAEASASVGIACVNAGITADLTLVDVRVPINASAVGLSGSVQWDLDVDLQLSSLDGELRLEINWCLAGEDYTLFSIDGFQKTYPLFSDAGCI